MILRQYIYFQFSKPIYVTKQVHDTVVNMVKKSLIFQGTRGFFYHAHKKQKIGSCPKTIEIRNRDDI